MMKPTWVSHQMVKAMHAQAIWFFGGTDGLRDQGLLESALSRPKNFFAYEDKPDMFMLAALYLVGLIQNHPFIDANECVAIIAAHSFLNLNGYNFTPIEKDLANIVMCVVNGQISTTELTNWFREYSSAS